MRTCKLRPIIKESNFKLSSPHTRKRGLEESENHTDELIPKKKLKKRQRKKNKKKANQVTTQGDSVPGRKYDEECTTAITAPFHKSVKSDSSALPKNLLILDLNGTLLVRSRKSKAIYMRPHVPEFVKFILENFAVIVWSSAMPENVNRMILKVFKQHRSLLLDVWNRSHLHLNQKDYYRKVDVIKDLSWVWEKHTRWNSTNTVLIDDTEHKGQLQPDNHICLDEFIKGDTDDNELLNVKVYLERFLKGDIDDIQCYIRNNTYVPSKLETTSSEDAICP